MHRGSPVLPAGGCRRRAGVCGVLEAIADPSHEEHEQCLQWVGGAFDPEEFDPAAVHFLDPARRWREVFGEE